MPGEVDQVSQQLGNLDGRFAGLQRSFDDHCAADDRRHSENIGTMREISASLTLLNQTMAPLVAAVAEMRPIVTELNASRLKQAGAIGLAVMLLSILGLALGKLIEGGAAAIWNFLTHH